MTEQDQGKKKLIEQLEKVNMRLQILDMIEDKLLNMKTESSIASDIARVPGTFTD